MIVKAIKTALFKENDSLKSFIKKHASSLEEGDILIITSKIVALAEGRVDKVEDKIKLIHKESKKVIETPWALLTLTNDGWGINAGVDESNAQNKLILLPKDSFKTAKLLCKNIKKEFSIRLKEKEVSGLSHFEHRQCEE